MVPPWLRKCGGEFRVVTLQLGFDFAEALLLVVIQ
jgi:hypothetical protein